jgi:hypothetical protein
MGAQPERTRSPKLIKKGCDYQSQAFLFVRHPLNERPETAPSALSCKARIKSNMQLAVQSVSISQNEPNFCSRLEQLTALDWGVSGQPAGGVEFIEENVADQACAFESPYFCRTNPI